MSIRYVQNDKIWIQQFHQQLVESGAAEAIDGIDADSCFEMLHENEIIDIIYQCCYIVCSMYWVVSDLPFCRYSCEIF